MTTRRTTTKQKERKGQNKQYNGREKGEASMPDKIWPSVPKEILHLIAENLDPLSLTRFSRVDQLSSAVASDDRLWLPYALTPFVYTVYSPYQSSESIGTVCTYPTYRHDRTHSAREYFIQRFNLALKIHRDKVAKAEMFDLDESATVRTNMTMAGNDMAAILILARAIVLTHSNPIQRLSEGLPADLYVFSPLLPPALFLLIVYFIYWMKCTRWGSRPGWLRSDYGWACKRRLDGDGQNYCLEGIEDMEVWASIITWQDWRRIILFDTAPFILLIVWIYWIRNFWWFLALIQLLILWFIFDGPGPESSPTVLFGTPALVLSLMHSAYLDDHMWLVSGLLLFVLDLCVLCYIIVMWYSHWEGRPPRPRNLLAPMWIKVEWYMPAAIIPSIATIGCSFMIYRLCRRVYFVCTLGVACSFILYPPFDMVVLFVLQCLAILLGSSYIKFLKNQASMTNRVRPSYIHSSVHELMRSGGEEVMEQEQDWDA